VLFYFIFSATFVRNFFRLINLIDSSVQVESNLKLQPVTDLYGNLQLQNLIKFVLVQDRSRPFNCAYTARGVSF
jgi:hypothetical protein